MSRTPTLQELFRLSAEGVARSIRVCLPGRIERYDAASGLADVKPLLQEETTGESDERIVESLPVVPGVPIVFFGAGGFVLTLPVKVGDPVALFFADRSLDVWKSSGTEVDPGPDPRRHALSDAFAIPGLRFGAWANAAAATDHMTAGLDGGLRLHFKPTALEVGEAAADAAALASKVLARLTAIETAFNLHLHTATGPTAPTTPPTVPVSSSTDVSSTALKLVS